MEVPASESPKMPATEVTPLLHGGSESSSIRSMDDVTSCVTDDATQNLVSGHDLINESASANKLRIAATFYGFFIVGATDGAYGVRRFRNIFVFMFYQTR